MRLLPRDAGLFHQPTPRVQERVLAGLTGIISEDYESRLNRVIEMEAHVTPASDPGVQLRYEQARSDVLSRLKAQGNISISIGEL